MIRRVRIYEGNDANTNIVGFSNSCVQAADDESFIDFFAERGYNVRGTQQVPEGGISSRYAEVQPPLSKSHAQELGQLCLGIIDGYQDGIEVIDVRQCNPAEIKGGGGALIASGL